MTLRKLTFVQHYRQKHHKKIETTHSSSTPYEQQKPRHHHLSGKNDKTLLKTAITVSVLCHWNESF